MYTRSPRMWDTIPLKKEDVKKFTNIKKKFGFSSIVVHMPYLPNLANSVDLVNHNKTRLTLLEEIKRVEVIEADFLVCHLGSHKGKGKEKGIKTIVEHLEAAINIEPNVKILLENSAGSKNSIGETFKEINSILEQISDRSKIGVCLDTCHTHAAGYDLNAKNIHNTIEIIESEIGLNSINVVHLNDIRGSLGSNKDRHEHIGIGDIGLDGFREFLRIKSFRSLPIILETPQDDFRIDKDNLQVVKTLLNDSVN
jgi:deoxyribonuclease IV